MSFGFSLGDFAVLGKLAWNIYKACKDAPEGFKNISQEVSSLHLVLKELEEIYSDADLSAAQQSRLETIGDGCRAVLKDLQCTLDKYNSLGTRTRRTWDRLRWDSNDIAVLRSRLVSNTVLLATFINTSQVIVQRRLDLFLQEFRDGKHEDSIISSQTVDSLSMDERQAWRAIRKELEDIGISIEAFNANKDYIVNWLKTAISTGAFEDQIAEDGSSTSILCEDDLSQSLVDPGQEPVLIQPSEDVRNDTGLKTTSVELQALELAPEVGIQIRRVPQVAALTTSLCGYNGGLFRAVQSGHVTKVRQLLARGADINIKDGYDRSTPLHCAVSSNSEVMIRLLLEMGADINTKNISGCTSLHGAARTGNEKLAQLLLLYRADIDAINDDGQTALHSAVIFRQETMVQFLLKNGPKVNEKDRRGYTALHWAAIWGCETVVQLLLEYGAKIDAKRNDGQTALHRAAVHGDETVVQLLLNHEAKIEAKSDHDKTALHQAAASGRETVVQLLLKNGAKINEEDRYGYTALGLAILTGSPGVEKLLRDAGGVENRLGIGQRNAGEEGPILSRISAWQVMLGGFEL